MVTILHPEYTLRGKNERKRRDEMLTPYPLKEHLEFQDFTGFRPSYSNLENFEQLGEKVAKNKKAP